MELVVSSLPCLIFLSQEYLALEIKNNKVRFSWDVGKGPGSVVHDLELQVFDVKLDEGEKWYRILAKRWEPVCGSIVGLW